MPSELNDFLEWLPKRRWFRAKSRRLLRVFVTDAIPFTEDGDAKLLFLDVKHDGGADDYVVLVDDESNDVLVSPEIAERLLACFGGPPLTGAHTTVRFEALPGFAARRGEPGATFEPKPVTTEQSNSSILYGNSFVLKILRQLDEGMSPDMEMSEFLTLAGYEHAPQLAGTIVVERGGKQPSTLGVLHRFVPNQCDAWTFTLAELWTERYPALAELLGRRVGQMHAALNSRADIPAFAPEPISRSRREAMVTAALAQLDRAAEKAPQIRPALPRLKSRLERFALMTVDPIATRVHGDLHLGQVLFTGDDFVIIDFEGEPARPLAHRRAKRPPLTDVAGIIRSFHYAAMTVVRERLDNADRARAWYRDVRAAFLRGWRGAAREPENAESILDYCLLEKCIYEVNYEADNRPDWLDIPVEGLLE